jgi:hypothetical protein
MESYPGTGWTFTSLANFLTNNPSSVVGALTPAQTDATRDFREIGIQPYFQDDWKITSRLTMNIGVRYEFVSNPVERLNKLHNIVDPPLSAGFTPVSHVFISNPSLKNFDPRFGLAFDPFKDHKTSIRAGFGLFHDLIEPRTYGGGLWLSPPFVSVQQQNPVFPYAFSSVTPTKTTTAQGWYYPTNATPYVFQYNFTIQRQIADGTVVTVAYIGSQGRRLISDLDLNPPIPNSSGALATLVGGKIVTNPRINNALGALIFKMPFSTSSYNALTAGLERHLTHNVQVQVSYSYSKCLDYGSATGGSEAANTSASIENPYNVATDHGRCSFDITQILRVNGVFVLPFHRNKLIEGWQLSGIASGQTGTALTVNDGFDQVGLQNTTGLPRPNIISGCNPILGLKAEWFNPACFAIEPVGTFGNLGRTTFNGPSLVNFDFAVMKNTALPKISEGFKVQFRAEVFNIFNHTNLGVPGLGAFTQGSNGGANPNASFGVFTGTTTTSRQIQLGLKLVF